jgi:tetratricopeptide (TPR) repeat protein
MTRRNKLAGLAAGLALGLFGLSSSVLAQGPAPAKETPPVLPPLAAPPPVLVQTPGAAEKPPLLPPMPSASEDSSVRQVSGISATGSRASKLIEEMETPKAFQRDPASPKRVDGYPAPPQWVDGYDGILGRQTPSRTVAESVCREGAQLVEKGHYKTAVGLFDESVHCDPTYVMAYACRAYALYEMKAYDRAILDLNKAIELDSTQLCYRWFRAMVYYRKQDYVRAVEDLNIVISTSPTKQEASFRFEAYRLRAVIFEITGDFRAASDFEEALKLRPEDQETLQGLAGLYAGCPNKVLRNGRRAIELATRACELEGWTSCYSLAALAAAHAETGDYEAARRWQERATQLAPGSNRLESLGRQIRFALRLPYRYSIHEEPPEGHEWYRLGWHYDPSVGLCISYEVIRPVGPHEIHFPLSLLAICGL